MLIEHKSDPQQWNAQNLAEKYKLDLETTYQIIEYFTPFNIKLPQAEQLVESTNPAIREYKRKHWQKQIEATQKLIDDSGYGAKKTWPIWSIA